VWNPAEHSDDDNARWARLRAIEWIGWPDFISQPIVPVLLYFCPWMSVMGALAAIALLWRVLVVPAWVSPVTAYIGVLFVQTKFIAAPLMAYLLWQRGERALALAALVWPWLGPFLIQCVMVIPMSVLRATPFGKKTLQIDAVQQRLLSAVGVQPTKTKAPPMQ